jgi:hypothetical protein
MSDSHLLGLQGAQQTPAFDMMNKLQNENSPSEFISTHCCSNCQTIECPQFSGSDIIKRSLEIDLEKVRQQVISPESIKNHLTSAWGFSTIIASGYATGGKYVG